MAEDRTPRVVSLTQPLDEQVPSTPHRGRASEDGQTSRPSGPLEDAGELESQRSQERSSPKPDEIHPPSII